MARIADTCEHIHMFQRTCVPRDIVDNCELDINTLVLLPDGDRQARRLELDPPGTSRAVLFDAAHHCGRRGRMARAPVRQPVELLRCAAAQVCRRRPGMPPRRGGRRHAGVAAVGRPGRCDRARLSRRHGFPGLGRMPWRAGLRQRHRARGTGDSRRLALRFGLAHRRDERRFAGAGFAVRRVRAGRQPSGLALRHRLRHDRRQVSRFPGRRRTRRHGVVRRALGSEHRLRGRRDVCQPPGNLSGKPAARQRRARGDRPA